jgi:hypothetical protein
MPFMPAFIMRDTALHPPPPTPMTFSAATGEISGVTISTVDGFFLKVEVLPAKRFRNDAEDVLVVAVVGSII